MGIHKCIDVAVYQKAKNNNEYCGDSYYYKETEDEFICVLADGLGSGKYAKESSQAVIDIVESNYNAPVDTLIKMFQQSLIGKRGVVFGLLRLDLKSKQYTFYSIGNVSVMAFSPTFGKKFHIPESGYLGGYTKPVKEVEADLEEGTVIVMFSDGVRAQALSSKSIIGKNVDAIIDYYSTMHNAQKEDDATLIAMEVL